MNKEDITKDFKNETHVNVSGKQKAEKRNIKGFIKALPVALAVGVMSIFGAGAAKDAIDKNQQEQIKAFDAKQNTVIEQQIELQKFATQKIESLTLAKQLLNFTNGVKDNDTIKIIAENPIITYAMAEIKAKEKETGKTMPVEDRFLKCKNIVKKQKEKVGHVKKEGKQYEILNS